MNRVLAITAAVLCMALSSLPVAASAKTRGDDMDKSTVVTSLTADQMQGLLVHEGYQVTESKKEDDNKDTTVLKFKMEGFNCQMFVFKDSLQFHCAWSGTNETLSKVNDWNRDHRYSRAYLDADGDPHLELDLDLAGGVTVARVYDFIKTSDISLGAYSRSLTTKS